MARAASIGIIGGLGILGRAIARALRKREIADAVNLWISNRSGRSAGGRSAGFETWRDKRYRRQRQAGARLPDDHPLGAARAGSEDRDLSSPATETGLTYSRWVATPEVGSEDRAHVAALFEACRQTDEIEDEGQMYSISALTGPVPGFVAYYAKCMIDAATARGIPPPRAVPRQRTDDGRRTRGAGRPCASDDRVCRNAVVAAPSRLRDGSGCNAAGPPLSRR